MTTETHETLKNHPELYGQIQLRKDFKLLFEKIDSLENLYQPEIHAEAVAKVINQQMQLKQQAFTDLAIQSLAKGATEEQVNERLWELDLQLTIHFDRLNSNYLYNFSRYEPHVQLQKCNSGPSHSSPLDKSESV